MTRKHDVGPQTRWILAASLGCEGRQLHQGSLVRRVVVLAAIVWSAGLMVAIPSNAQDPSRAPVLVDRLVIQYQAGQFTLVSRTTMTKVLPASDSLPSGSAWGFWYELQSSDGTTRYRRIVSDPIPFVFEGPDPDGPPGKIQRTEVMPDARLFSVLTPRCAPGDSLVLFGTRFETNAASAAAQQPVRIQVLP